MIQSDQNAPTNKILARARRTLRAPTDFAFGNPLKCESEFCALQLFTAKERFDALQKALDEISARDRKGPNPPNNVASHPPHKGVRLYAFRWESKSFGCEMYLKFGLTPRNNPTKLVLYSLHQTD